MELIMNSNRFEMLLQNESKKLYNFLLKILRNREDAEDLLQETFIAFHSKMDSIQESSYTSYLFKTAYHKALNHIKKRDKKNNIMTNYDEMELFEEQKSETDHHKNALIKMAISQLKPEEATIIELQFYQKKSYKEISEILEMSVGAVDSKLVRTKRKLKKIIMQDSNQNGVLKNRGEKNETGTMPVFEKA